MLKNFLRLLFSLMFMVFCASCLESCISDDSKEEPVPEVPDPPVNPNPDPPLPDAPCKTNIITGYTDKVSYYTDEKVVAFLQGSERVELCRLDIYDVNSQLAFSIASSLAVQTINPDNPSVNGYGFQPTVTFNVPGNIPSGLYLIENKIPFIVKTKSPVDLMIIYPSNTVNAYCESGGKSLYSTSNRPVQVSFHRPMVIQNFSEYCLKWFTTLTEYSIGYIADEDLEEYDNISGAGILVIPGHSEYWTKKARLNFDSFVDNGHDALILSGNTMWWQVRYTEDYQLVCYRDESDPVDPLLKTLNWNTPSLTYSILSSIGGDFSYGGYGLKTDQGWNGYKIANNESPLLSGLNLQKGDIIYLPTTEYDGVPIASFDTDGYPVVDFEKLNAEKVEIIGFDKGFRLGNETIGTFIVFKKSASSGVIVNTGTTDWCSLNGMGGVSGDRVKKITYNAIDKLLRHENIFSP